MDDSPATESFDPSDSHLSRSSCFIVMMSIRQRVSIYMPIDRAYYDSSVQDVIDNGSRFIHSDERDTETLSFYTEMWR